MSINSILKSISEFTDPNVQLKARLKDAKDELLSVCILGIILTIVIAGICFGVMCLRFLVFGG